MIGNRVKVINYSWGYGAYAFAASQGEQYAINFFDEMTGKMDAYLGGLVDDGYDFLIVTSAGNANNKEFYKYIIGNQADSKERYVSKEDYCRSNDAEREYPLVDINVTYGAPNANATISCSNVDAQYTNVFAYSQDSRIRDRVIVVGAIAEPVGNPRKYNVTGFSNTGSRVEILAPGDNILSCMISGMGLDYDFKSGTSMAAPHVSGVAGLAYNVNPDISAPELKDIIVSNYQMAIDGYGVLNAADVIAAVVPYETPEEDEEYTVQLHVTDANGNVVKGAAVEVRSRSQYWYRILGGAMTTRAVGDIVVCSGETDALGNIKLNIPWGNYYVLLDGEYGGVLEEISVSNEDIADKVVKEIMVPDYQPEEMREVVLQHGSRTAGENVSIYGFIKNADIRFIKGWIDIDGKEDIPSEDYVREEDLSADGGQSVAVYHTGETLGDISVRLPEGIYTVEVTLPDAEPKYYHIIVSDTCKTTFYRFDI